MGYDEPALANNVARLFKTNILVQGGKVWDDHTQVMMAHTIAHSYHDKESFHYEVGEEDTRIDGFHPDFAGGDWLVLFSSQNGDDVGLAGTVPAERLWALKNDLDGFLPEVEKLHQFLVEPAFYGPLGGSSHLAEAARKGGVMVMDEPDQQRVYDGDGVTHVVTDDDDDEPVSSDLFVLLMRTFDLYCKSVGYTDLRDKETALMAMGENIEGAGAVAVDLRPAR